jgi:hypothetical protein
MGIISNTVVERNEVYVAILVHSRSFRLNCFIIFFQTQSQAMTLALTRTQTLPPIQTLASPTKTLVMPLNLTLTLTPHPAYCVFLQGPIHDGCTGNEAPTTQKLGRRVLHC